ncbi:PREDICTED: uncharacterized protein LOC104597680 isoform X1 [Nelumbo nucifera]|uniref:Uncharacterized protein LOC104597680 isoform X1 n=1 Tax=Nelumbo nucifera TaxID=4432 RepID=A0A1U8A860_NELNU|nr:PREDICTED: uncharacterized protein LOC104597680 isoform X1 [Nelumbo nucifera]
MFVISPVQEYFMKVSFCKFHCPSFICFCKPSPQLLCPSPLKLEDTPHVPSPLSPVPVTVVQFCDKTIEPSKESLDGKQQVESYLKSSLKRPYSEPAGVPKEVVKAKVKWVDFFGKELLEIKEFEPSESGDSDDEGNGTRGCVCVIQ